MPDNTRKDNTRTRDTNPDPITGAPGSHPVGTGVGAAAGGAAGVAGGMAAGAAAGTAGAGPIGGAIGAAVGAVVGGMAGKGIAEQVNPTAEDAYWREHYSNEPYYDRTYAYDDYRGAYRTGYEGFARLGASGRRYEEIEPELRRDYERNYGTSRLAWDRARDAVRAAWYRFHHDQGTSMGAGHSGGTQMAELERYIGYDVVDRSGNKIGTLDCLWADTSGQPAFVGVRTGWFLGKTHVVPAESVEVSDQSQRLRLPYTEDKVRNAPAIDAESDISDAEEAEIYRYYGIQTGTMASAQRSTDMTGSARSAQRSTATDLADTARTTGTSTTGRREDNLRTGTAGRDEARMQLSEEQLTVGKREVEAGGVRLRKVVRTETVNRPVELRREEIVIERVPAQGTTARPGEASFREQEVYIPLRREEAVVQKDVRVREEVHARKESQTETQQVSGQVRKEDVDVERTGEARERGPRQTGTGSGNKPR